MMYWKMEIKFYAECLTSLHVATYPPYKLSLPNLPALHEAILDFDMGCEPEFVNIVLKAISSVHHLTLTKSAIQELDRGDLFTKLLALSSLKSLTIEMSKIGESIIDGYELTELFHNLRNIESLIFNGGLTRTPSLEKLMVGE